MLSVQPDLLPGINLLSARCSHHDKTHQAWLVLKKIQHAMPMGKQQPQFELEIDHVVWMDNNMKVLGTGLCVSGLLPGAYCLQITSTHPHATKKGLAKGDQSKKMRMFEIKDNVIPAVVAYSVVDTSSECAWDGTIEALVENRPDDCRFLWSNDTITSEPRLSNVRHGNYFVTLISKNEHYTKLQMLHLCDGCRVSFK